MWLFYLIGILVLIHLSWLCYRLLVSYYGKPTDVKGKFNAEWALITGANSGIGKLIAIDFAKQGINIIGTGRDQERLNEVKKHCEAQGVEFISVTVDQEVSVQPILDAIADKEIAVAMLNAGYGIYGDLAQWDDEKIKKYIYLMCTSNAVLASRLIEKMRTRKAKSLIYMTSSLAGNTIAPNGQLYCSVKAYNSSLARNLQCECHGTNVQVQAMHPGFFKGSRFFDHIPAWLGRAFGTGAKIADAEEVSKAILRTIGGPTWVDFGGTSIFFRVLCWVGQEPICLFMEKYLIKQTRAASKKSD